MSPLATGPHNRVPAIRLRAGNFVFALWRLITDDQRQRRAAQTRRKTEEEIASLPASLRRDIALSDDLKHNDI